MCCGQLRVSHEQRGKFNNVLSFTREGEISLSITTRQGRFMLPFISKGAMCCRDTCSDKKERCSSWPRGLGLRFLIALVVPPFSFISVYKWVSFSFALQGQLEWACFIVLHGQSLCEFLVHIRASALNGLHTAVNIFIICLPLDRRNVTISNAVYANLWFKMQNA